MMNAEHAVQVWHRDGRQAAAECLSARTLGDALRFAADCQELQTLLAKPAYEPVIETARWVFVNQWGVLV